MFIHKDNRKSVHTRNIDVASESSPMQTFALPYVCPLMHGLLRRPRSECYWKAEKHWEDLVTFSHPSMASSHFSFRSFSSSKPHAELSHISCASLPPGSIQPSSISGVMWLSPLTYSGLLKKPNLIHWLAQIRWGENVLDAWSRRWHTPPCPRCLESQHL